MEFFSAVMLFRFLCFCFSASVSALSTQQSAVSQSKFTVEDAKDAEEKREIVPAFCCILFCILCAFPLLYSSSSYIFFLLFFFYSFLVFLCALRVLGGSCLD